MRSLVRRMFAARSFGRFLVVGVVNTVVGITVFPILYWLFIQYLEINVLLGISYVIGTLSAFGLHRLVTFESRGVTRVEGSKFFMLSGLTFLANLVLLNGLLPFLQLHPIILQTAIAIALQVGNYLVMSRLIFVPATAKDDSENGLS